jgi:hypothetical protein
MTTRAILPGALIAGLLTAAAVLALVVALGVRGEGPLALGVGEADGAARLDGGGSATLGRPTPGVRETTPVVLPGGGVAAPAAGAPARRRATALRGTAGDRQVTGRRITRTPAKGAPVATPKQPTTTTTTTTRPTATSTPNPNAVKVRGRAPAASPKPLVNKRRVPAGGAAPAPVPVTPVPAPQAPDLTLSAPPAPTGTPSGAPPLTRVPPPSATP